MTDQAKVINQHPLVPLDQLLSMLGHWMQIKQSYPKVVHPTSIFQCFYHVVFIFFCFQDVAFRVGGSTSIKYLVLQVHYSNLDKFKGKCSFSVSLSLSLVQRNHHGIFLAGQTDRSGLILTTSPTP